MIRKIQPLDHDFVYHSWLHSVKCPTKMVTTMTRKLIDDVVSKEQVSIYCPDGDPDHIIGWASWGKLEDTPVLHFVFVKKDFRQNGIGTELLRSIFPKKNSTIFTTFWSFHTQQMNAKDKWGLKFRSHLLPTVIFEIMDREVRAALRAIGKTTEAPMLIQ